MMVLRQYSADYRGLCSFSKQAAHVAHLPPGRPKTNLTGQRSHWAVFVILDEHVCVCVCVRGCDNDHYRQIDAPFHMHLMMKQFEKHRGHREDEPWRWCHHSPESRTTNVGFFFPKQRMFVCSLFFLFQNLSRESTMWRHSALTFVSPVTDSLCVSLQRIGGRAEAHSRPFGVEY